MTAAVTMTDQEIFNRVLFEMRGRNYARSVSRYGACVYRGDNGLRCAAGLFLSDENYTELIEGIALFDASEILRRCGKKFDVDEAQLDLLAALQRVHDLYEGETAFERHMEALAARENLTYTPLQGASS
jgi:hypothetical protein